MRFQGTDTATHAKGKTSLQQLAQSLAQGNDYTTAIALRKLAQAGYTSLEQVDRTPDWILLSIPGVGVKRLGAVRALTRPNWRPPSAHAIQTIQWYLSAASLALRSWPVENLVPVARSLVSVAANSARKSVDERLAMDVFAKAAREARSYSSPQELVQILHLIANGHQSLTAWDEENPACGELASTPPAVQPQSGQECVVGDSDRYAYSSRKRREIVEHYRAARDSGKIEHKDHWAQTQYNISGRTLLNYEREFPEDGLS